MAEESAALADHQFSQRTLIRSVIGRSDGGAGLAGLTVKIGGWIKTGRKQEKGAFAFLQVNDGSCLANLQVIVDETVHPLSQLIQTGSSILVEGLLQLPPTGKTQKIELKAVKVIAVGAVDPAKYPLPKTTLNFEFLRDYVHLRPRTSIISSIARIRSQLSFATHIFFQQHGFVYVHTPIITTSDCEGAGEMFQVTTLIKDSEKELIKNSPPSLTAICQAKDIHSKCEERSKRRARTFPWKDGKIDYTQDFFARQAFLTVSGQLQLESYACALSNVYTFGPTFRAEHSHTNRHLAEFWMVEPEIAFADIHDAMNCAEEYVKFLCMWLLEKCMDEMKLMVNFDKGDKGAIDRLEMVSSSDFVRITYTEAVSILEEASEIRQFANKVKWVIDLSSEHERYLTEEKYKKPVIVYNYPKGIKAFYMKVNPDNKTVAAMDVLVPQVGELIGGSQREERYEVLEDRILEMGLPLEPYEWYLDLRRFGTVTHSGFGLGLERMILFATGMDNIRDVIPFPRFPGRADL